MTDAASRPRTSRLHIIAFGALVLAAIAFLVMMIKEDAANAAYSRAFDKLSMPEVEATVADIERIRHATHRWLLYVLLPLDAITFLLAVRARRRYGGASGILVAIACGWLAFALAVAQKAALIPPGGTG